ncbi:MAG: hypothetical protein JZU55_05270, partial [Afipia sp.]|nr:hypothetical protein [Afipia sp.]
MKRAGPDTRDSAECKARAARIHDSYGCTRKADANYPFVRMILASPTQDGRQKREGRPMTAMIVVED